LGVRMRTFTLMQDLPVLWALRDRDRRRQSVQPL
jgi:hypothetical protein